jgi:hypothetical protein
MRRHSRSFPRKRESSLQIEALVFVASGFPHAR